LCKADHAGPAILPTAPPPKSVFTPPLGYMGMAHMPKAKASAKTTSIESPTSSVLSLFPEPANAQPVSPLVASLTPAVGPSVPPELTLESLPEEPAETNDRELTEQHVAWATFDEDDEHEQRTPQTREPELPPAAAGADTSHDRLTDLEKWKLTAEAESCDRLAQLTSTQPFPARSKVAVQKARILVCDLYF
jgi:hypothetical protein